MDSAILNPRATKVVMPDNEMETETAAGEEIALSRCPQDLNLGISPKTSKKIVFTDESSYLGGQHSPDVQTLDVELKSPKKANLSDALVNRRAFRVETSQTPEVIPPTIYKEKSSKRRLDCDIGVLEDRFKSEVTVKEPHPYEGETLRLVNLVNKKAENIQKTGSDNTEIPISNIVYKNNLPNLNDFNVVKMCSSGSFGAVAKMEAKTGEKIVFKQIKQQRSKINPNEILIPLKLESLHLGQVFAFGYNGNSAFMVQSDEGESLYHIIRYAHGKEAPPKDLVCPFQYPLQVYFRIEKNICFLLRDILSGVNVLHKNGIKHCDIKPENICLKFSSEGDRYVAVLIDFGTAQTKTDTPSLNGITPEYLDPVFNYKYNHFYQALKKKVNPGSTPSISFKGEVWSVGMTLTSIKHGCHPVIKYFTNLDNYPPGITNDDRFKVLAAIGDMQTLDESFFHWKEYPKLNAVLSRMLTIDETERCNAAEALASLNRMLGVDQAATVTKVAAARENENIWRPPVKRMRSEMSVDEDSPPASPAAPPLSQNVVRLKVSKQYFGTIRQKASQIDEEDCDIDKQNGNATIQGQHPMEVKKLRKVEQLDDDTWPGTASKGDKEYSESVNSYVPTTSKSQLKIIVTKNNKVEPAFEQTQVAGPQMFRQDSFVDLKAKQAFTNKQKVPVSEYTGAANNNMPLHALLKNNAKLKTQPRQTETQFQVSGQPTNSSPNLHRTVYMRNGNIQQQLQQVFPDQVAQFDDEPVVQRFKAHTPLPAANNGRDERMEPEPSQHIPNFDMLF